MEAYTDLVTSTFQASLGVLLVGGAGYLFSGTDSNISKLVRMLCGLRGLNAADPMSMSGTAALEQETAHALFRICDARDI
jgi:hypothetical protein